MSDKLESAKRQFLKVKSTWQKIVDDLSQDKNRECSNEEGNRIRLFFNSEADRFHIYYSSAYSDHEFALEVDSFENEFGTKLERGLLDGNRRYDNEMHKRKIASLEAYGNLAKNLGINIAALVVGILIAIFGQKIL